MGGLIGAAAIGAVIAFFIIRRRRARSAPSTAYMSGQGGSEMGEPVPYPLTSDTPRLYVSIIFFLLFAWRNGGSTMLIHVFNRTLLIRRRTHIRRYPRLSTRRPRAISTIVPPATYNPTDRHTAVCQRFERGNCIRINIMFSLFAFSVAHYSQRFTLSLFLTLCSWFRLIFEDIL